VEIKDYALCGFSAGGNLAGIYGSHSHGYDAYSTQKPGILMLGYPWTNISHWADHPYWNIWLGLMGVWFSIRGYIYMFGLHSTKAQRDSLCVQDQVTPDYPRTFMFTGGMDVLVPASHHAEVFEQALRRENVPYIYRRYFGLPHGIGLGLHTHAASWIQEAIDFWEEA
jgi:acetyl esterase/lipase